MSKLLSKRAEIVTGCEDFFYKYLQICNTDPYDEKDNPEGMLNLGTSQNNLCCDIVHPRMSSKEIWECDTDLLQHKEGYGIQRLREAFASFMTKFFESHEPVSPDNLFCLTGVTSCLDVLAHCLADPGEVFLAPFPLYGRIETDFHQRSLVDVWPILILDDESEDRSVLTLEKVTEAYGQAIRSNLVVRGICLINPSNPLGDIYSPQLLMDIMTFCKAHSLHLVVDEVYALSVHSKTEEFHNMLKFHHFPDPERVHVLYGISKDFGLSGLRVGVLHTVCEPLQRCIKQLSYFQTISNPIMEITARYLEDLDWCKEYLATFRRRLAEKHDYCVKFLKKIGLNVHHSSAGFFAWVDFRHICGTFDEESAFFDYLIEKKRLYINPGKEFFCPNPGWFRIVFTGNPDHVSEGLIRLEQAVNEYKPKQQ